MTSNIVGAEEACQRRPLFLHGSYPTERKTDSKQANKLGSQLGCRVKTLIIKELAPQRTRGGVSWNQEGPR